MISRSARVVIALSLALSAGEAGSWVPITNALVVFERGSSELRPEGKAVLDDFATSLRYHEEGVQLFVEGGAEPGGGPTENRALSCRRAASVAAYLRSRGVNEGQMNLRGYGAVASLLNGAMPGYERLRLRRVVVRFAFDQAGRDDEWPKATGTHCAPPREEGAPAGSEKYNQEGARRFSYLARKPAVRGR